MINTRKICCFCCISLEPLRFIKFATLICLINSFLGLIVEFFSLFDINNSLGRFLKPLLILLHFFIICISPYILFQIKKNNFNKIRIFGIFMVIASFTCLIKMFISTVIFIIKFSVLLKKITNERSKRNVSIGLFNGLIILGLYNIYLIWIINVSLGIIKMHTLLVKKILKNLQRLDINNKTRHEYCLLYTSPSPRD